MRRVLAVLALVVATAGCEVVVSGDGAAPAGPSPAGGVDGALVTEVVRIVDGDTLVLADLDERLRRAEGVEGAATNLMTVAPPSL